ncbi:hypothetical protein [Nitrosovibrio tenuis]|uniref:Uncharacterized protein n=1 Tax=Nitrosovibrio tenuis TaxID=1233 RepID=A0A1H7KQ87_9PROT|nr:hypothetical protein [Nitrosovibrio tenuis]SEK88949.1 hypothetical protein SAMN05216387_103305 [Nitrosovibrio tenuis]
MKNNPLVTTTQKVKTYDTTMPLLDSMYQEFKELSKKKPDAAVNKNKITIVNRLLHKMRLILEDEESIEFLDLIDEDDIPQASDVTLILSQYVAAMNGFRSKYYEWNGHKNQWRTEN